MQSSLFAQLQLNTNIMKIVETSVYLWYYRLREWLLIIYILKTLFPPKENGPLAIDSLYINVNLILSNVILIKCS